MTISAKAIAASALMLFIIVGLLSYQSTVREEVDRSWVTHTHIVMEQIDAIRLEATQTENALRGYILTGQDPYLALYGASVVQLRADINGLRKLTSDNPKEQSAISCLEPLTEARIAGLESRRDIRGRSGLLAAAKAVEEGNGEQLMGEIHGILNEMRQTEQGLLDQRLKRATASAHNVKIIIVLGDLLALCVLMLAAGLIFRETMRRNMAEDGLNNANQHLRRQRAELSDTNAELESFSYSVAHDLRAPLRQIAGYSQVLLEECGPALDGEAPRYLEKIAEGASKMGHLVDDLLGLSRIGRQELSLERTSLDKLLRQVMDDLAPECLDRNVEWQVSQLFHTDCDPGLMKQVFVNLLSNAVKYTRKKEQAVIEVGQMTQEGERVIFVRDNGAGFEMQYANKLFGVFQRLHKARDFEGTGVGLAIVHRIIRKHGGRIWAEGKVEQGATFFFTLGSPQNNSSSELKGVIN